MELAGRVFDIVTDRDNVLPEIAGAIPEITQQDKHLYWRKVLRMAALCHDLGHLPFSHAAEKQLLPADWNHEKMTAAIVNSSLMGEIWGNMTPPLRPFDVAKLAVGPQELPDQQFSTWEALLSEIVVGNAFGIDRIDYLLRDSHHVGVAYGKFDHYRLIDTLRILPTMNPDNPDDLSGEPTLAGC